MATGYVLSEADVKVLRDLLAREKRRPVTKGRPAPPVQLGQAPDVYLAVTPAPGIPALVADDGTGTGAAEATPGYADCTIYRVIETITGADAAGTGTGTDRVMTPSMMTVGFALRVYNLSGLDVPGDAWGVVARDKFGTWFWLGTGGSDAGGGPGPGPGGGTCELAALSASDCVLATDGTQSLYLGYDENTGRWRSAFAGTGTGLVASEEYVYPGGRGEVEFWCEAGRFHLSVDGMELVDCGNGCFTGGAATGHVADTTTGTAAADACDGETFTICVECVDCPEAAESLISIACATSPIPEVLHLVTTQTSGTCPDYVYDGPLTFTSLNTWTATYSAGGGTVQHRFICNPISFVWTWDITFNGVPVTNATLGFAGPISRPVNLDQTCNILFVCFLRVRITEY